MLTMYTYDGKWIVKDNVKGRDRFALFDSSYDAWCYIFLLKEIRPKVPFVERSLYPVRSLNPFPERRTKNVRIHT